MRSQVRQVELIILAKPGDECIAAVAQVVDFQFAGTVDLLLLLAPGAAGRSACIPASLAFLPLLLALAGQCGQGCVPPSPCRGSNGPALAGLQHGPLAFLQASGGCDQVLLSLHPFLATLAQVRVDLPVPGPQAGEPLLDLGQGHLGRRAVLLPLLPLLFALADLLLGLLPAQLQRLHLRSAPSASPLALLPGRLQAGDLLLQPLISLRLICTSSCSPSRRSRCWPIRERRSAACSARTSISS